MPTIIAAAVGKVSGPKEALECKCNGWKRIVYLLSIQVYVQVVVCCFILENGTGCFMRNWFVYKLVQFENKLAGSQDDIGCVMPYEIELKPG